MTGMTGVDALLLPVYVVLIALFYWIFAWVARRLIDPDGSMRELPLPGFIRWPVFIAAIFAPPALVGALAAILRLLTLIIA